VEAPRPRPPPGAPSRTRGAFRALAGSFAAAWDGLVETALHQRNMRIHLVSGLLVALVGSAVELAPAEKLALLLCVFLVVAAEVANSALEELVDLVTRDHHEGARAAKDAGAAAVLVLAVGAVMVLVAVLVHAWPDVLRARGAVVRQALTGVPLAGATAALLAPWHRSAAVDVALGAAGLSLLGVAAAFSESPLFTGLAVLLFAVAVAVARRRRRQA
jgi:diacylglycerol kinase (ATP)